MYYWYTIYNSYSTGVLTPNTHTSSDIIRRYIFYYYFDNKYSSKPTINKKKEIHKQTTNNE